MTAAMQQTPAVPPRPSKTSDKDIKDEPGSPVPKVPSRPVKKQFDRALSPNPDRFAPSPFHEGISRSPRPNSRGSGHGYSGKSADPIHRSASVPRPSVGEEGMEYSAVASESKKNEKSSSGFRPTSPEQTRTVGEDLQLHAPKPSLPALSAKQRVAMVTRTDSDKAASFGIGRASFEDRAASRDGLKKKPSTTFSTVSDQGQQTDEEHGIPEIGQRVPMNPNLGDVQAPSPAPGAEGTKKNHARKHSARGLPPGSYGFFGHGVTSQDSLDKAWYQKHPEQKERDQHSTPLHDRQNDFVMSSADLNRLVRDTASRAAAQGSPADMQGTPTDAVAFQATEEYTSRMSSPRPGSAAPRGDNHITSPLNKSFDVPSIMSDDDGVIHVDDDTHPEYRSYGNEDPGDAGEGDDYSAPILASDEVEKDPNAYRQLPAIHHQPERRDSAFEAADGWTRPTSRSASRPTSRPASIHGSFAQNDFDSTPLEDVQEYEPLFADETKVERVKREAAEKHTARHHFPSKDIWEDAPKSAHHTAQVSTPDLSEQTRRRSSNHYQERPLTPAHAFALHQEQLAEDEARGISDHHGAANRFLSLSSEERPSWIGHQAHLRPERAPSAQRFPSRDIWEEAPESQLQQTTISPSPKAEPEPEPEAPARPATKTSDSSDRPAVPGRPKPRQLSGDDQVKAKPPVSDKPKPQIPARPSKSLSGDSVKSETSSKQKPPVPSRPVGGKIAALQAGFMSDLNKRLQLGPQGPKKEDPAQEENVEQEKIPLPDARKSRARGPQRRAPAKSSTSTEAVEPVVPSLGFSVPQTVWTIDPDEGSVAVDAKSEETPSKADDDVLTAEPDRLAEADEPRKEDETTAPETTEEQTTEEQTTEEQTTEAQTTEEQTTEEPQARKLVTPDPDEQAQAQGAHVAENLPQGGPAVEEPAKEEPTREESTTDKTTNDEPAPEEPAKEMKSLAFNMAGESILQTTVEKKDDGDEVEPVAVGDAVKE